MIDDVTITGQCGNGDHAACDVLLNTLNRKGFDKRCGCGHHLAMVDAEGVVLMAGDVVTVRLAKGKKAWQGVITRLVFKHDRFDHVEVIGGPGKHSMMRALRSDQVLFERRPDRSADDEQKKGKK